MKGLLLLSGGIDSVTALYMAEQFIDSAILIQYGQKNFQAEFEVSRLHCSRLKKTLITRSLPHAFIHSSSRLLKGRECGDYNLEGRNAFLFSVALSMAESEKYDSIYSGIYHTDYGDTSEKFLEGMKLVAEASSKGTVTIETPLAQYSKSEVIKLGNDYGFKIDLETHSCFESERPLEHCGECPTCITRRRAFIDAGILDKTKYLR